jgi:hypothetical protein
VVVIAGAWLGRRQNLDDENPVGMYNLVVLVTLPLGET